MTEWGNARSLLSSYDNNLHDLRKYGFTFLTALLTAESILLPSQTSATGPSGLPNYVKLGVFLVTLLLIYVLHLIDQNYLVFEQAANTRAIVLERELNIELSEIIADRYERTRVRTRVEWVYVLFALGVWVLGVFVFTPDSTRLIYFVFLFGAFLLTWYGIRNTKNNLKVKYRFTDKDDWTVTPLVCIEGDPVRITLNNLTEHNLNDQQIKQFPVLREPGNKAGEEGRQRAQSREGMEIPVPIKIVEGSIVWQIEDQENRIVGDPVKAAHEILVFENYTWLWDTTGKTGIFQVHPYDRLLPLNRKIVVLPASETRSNYGEQ
jgi:hypothetical protein